MQQHPPPEPTSPGWEKGFAPLSDASLEPCPASTPLAVPLTLEILMARSSAVRSIPRPAAKAAPKLATEIGRAHV